MHSVGVLLVVLLAVASSCSCGPKKVAYAKVPLTVSDAKKQAKELGAEIRVIRQLGSNIGNGPSCGHSLVCVAVLPVILVQLASSEKWEEIVLEKNGEVLLSAIFDENGNLRHAQHLKDGEVIETAMLTLASLGQEAYVDIAKLKPLPDGGTEHIPLALKEQHDFVADERALLEKEKTPKRRALAIVDAAYLLGPEGRQFATELLERGESDHTRGEVVRQGCWNKQTFAETLWPLLEKEAGPWVQLRAIDCATEGSPERLAATGRFLTLACDPKTKLDVLGAFEGFDRITSDKRQEILRSMGPCPSGPRRTLLSLWLRADVDPVELKALGAAPEMSLAIPYLRVDRAEEAAILVKVIADNHVFSGSLLERLEKENVVLKDPMLVEAVATRFVARTGFLERTDRPTTLALLARVGSRDDAHQVSRRARVVFARAAAAARKPDEKAMYEALQTLLGDRQRLEAASSVITHPKPSADQPANDEEVTLWILRQLGCSQDQLDQAAMTKRGISKCSRAITQPRADE